MSFPFELVERRVEYAKRIHVGVGKALDRPGKIVCVTAFVNKRTFTASLAAGVDRLFGDRDVDLAECLANAESLVLDAIVRVTGIDQAGHADALISLTGLTRTSMSDSRMCSTTSRCESLPFSRIASNASSTECRYFFADAVIELH